MGFAVGWNTVSAADGGSAVTGGAACCGAWRGCCGCCGGNEDLAAPTDGCGAPVRRLSSHSSRNEPLPAGFFAAGRVRAPAAPRRWPVGNTAIRLSISALTTALGRPYLAADSCFSAWPSLGFSVPSGGNAAILNGWVGTPPIKVRTMEL